MDKNTAFCCFLNNTLKSCRKRKRDLEEEVLYLRNKRRRNNDENENILVLSTVEAALAMTSKQQEPRKPKVDRDASVVSVWLPFLRSSENTCVQFSVKNLECFGAMQWNRLRDVNV